MPSPTQTLLLLLTTTILSTALPQPQPQSTPVQTCPEIPALPLSGPFFTFLTTSTTPGATASRTLLAQGAASRGLGFIANISSPSFSPTPNPDAQQFYYNPSTLRLSGPEFANSSAFTGAKGERILWNDFENGQGEDGGLVQVVSGCGIWLVPKETACESEGVYGWGVEDDGQPAWGEGAFGVYLQQTSPGEGPGKV